MATQFTSSRHQNALKVPTAYRRVIQITAERALRTLEIQPTSLTLTQDARRAQRWGGSFTIVDSDLAPQRPGDLLTPFGTTVGVRIGLELSDGSVATVPYGTYSISSSSTNTGPDGTTTEVVLSDLSDAVDRYRFETPFPVSSGTDLAQVVNLVLFNRTGVNPSLPNTGRVLTANRVMGLDPETGPWSELLDIIDGFGYTIWYDRQGNAQIGQMSIPGDAYLLSSPSSVQAAFDSRPSNIVVVRSEPENGTPIQAVAFDNDSSSPTYAGDNLDLPPSTPYGRVTRFYSTPQQLDASTALQTAEKMLAAALGGGASQDITLAYDPTIDVNDVVNVGGTKFSIDSVSLDLSGDTALVARRL